MNSRLGNGAARFASPQLTQGRDRGLAAFRIALGAYWLYEQHWKLPPDFGLYQSRGLMFAFQQSIQYPTLSLYKTFLQVIVVPHFHLFGWLVFVAEVTIGVALLLGFETKAAALLGTMQAVNLLIAQAHTPEGPWIYSILLLASLLVLLTPTNRQWSVDHILAPRLLPPASQGNVLARLVLRLM